MASAKPIFTKDTFQFLRDLGRNNKKTWMDANRGRYQAAVVQPFRRFLEKLSPGILELDANFDTTGRTGANFSRINRDIRFAKDKTPYRTQMYVKFSVPFPGDGETGQLYVGLSAETVTAGFRIYAGAKRKESALAVIAAPRVAAKPGWLARQKRRLARKYESYWYSTVKANGRSGTAGRRRKTGRNGMAGSCAAGFHPRRRCARPLPASARKFSATCIRSFSSLLWASDALLRMFRAAWPPSSTSG